MKHPRFRAFLSLGLIACMTLSLMPLGCSSVKLHHYPGQDDRPRVPEATEARLKECVEELKDDINAGSYWVDAMVKVDKDGHVIDAETKGTPNPGVGACMRMALREMRLPEDVLEQGTLRRSASANGQAIPDRALMGEVVTVTVVTIVFVEVVIEAFAITLGVTVAATVAAGAAEAVERNKQERMCMGLLQECLGNKKHPNPDFGPEKDCGACFRYCKREGYWPEDKCPR